MGNEVLQNAQEIELIRPAADNRWVFAAAPNAEFKRKYFDITTSNLAETNVSAFGGHWKRNEATGELYGSSTFLGLRFDKAIRSSGLWVPGILEARVLDAKKKLSNNVYRDFGIAVFDKLKYNVGIAKSIVERARKEGWELPILASFRDLDYQINSDAQYGVDVSVVPNPRGLVKGRVAQEVLEQFTWKGSSGALRLYRNYDGNWYANDNYLAGSNGYGRVGDWICGEAACAELKEAYDALNERQFGAKIRELEQPRQTKKQAFYAELEKK